jgi:hypothetical protein
VAVEHKVALPPVHRAAALRHLVQVPFRCATTRRARRADGRTNETRRDARDERTDEQTRRPTTRRGGRTERGSSFRHASRRGRALRPVRARARRRRPRRPQSRARRTRTRQRRACAPRRAPSDGRRGVVARRELRRRGARAAHPVFMTAPSSPIALDAGTHPRERPSTGRGDMRRRARGPAATRRRAERASRARGSGGRETASTRALELGDAFEGRGVMR